MNSVRTLGLGLAALAVSAGVALAGRSAHATSHTPAYDVAAERAQRDADIAFYQQHAARDPSGALDHLRLAALYLQRARERATPADLALAEAEARQSLANRQAHNAEAWHALALALVGQHQFVEARADAESLLTFDPTSPGPRSLLGEIDLELGRYLEADSIFAPLDRPGAESAVLARVARWASLRGHALHARTRLLEAREAAHAKMGTPAEQIAWYDLRLGELALTTGHYREAGEHLRDARAVVPDDPRILLALARLALAEKRGAEALESATAAMNAGEDPLAFAIASDAYASLGDTARGSRMFRAFETAIAAAPPSAWHRQWRLELLDHGHQIGAVLAQATEELKTRRDVYGWDLYAWALHAAGREAEARVAMREALRWNTEDVLLDTHAKALGVSR